jgi:uncharacterized membrane protein
VTPGFGEGAPGAGGATGGDAGPVASDPGRPSRENVGRILRRYFLTGLAVILPAAVSAFILWKLFVALDSILGRFVSVYYGRHVPGVGFVALVVLILGIGAIASNIIGRRLIEVFEGLLERIPVVRWIYMTIKQLFSAILEERSTSFRKVVLIPFPHPGTWSMAFLTAESAGRLDETVGRELVSVFLPTTPNPTSGYFILVPKEDVRELPMTVNEGLRYIISAGALSRTVGDGGPEG